MIQIRLANSADASFIYATWLRSYKHSSQFAKKIADDVYYLFHHAAIDRIAARGGKFYIAHPQGDPGTILGFICVEGDSMLHYCYMKKTFRGMGIGKKLVQESGLIPGYTFTHLTKDMEKISAKLQRLTYNPYGI